MADRNSSFHLRRHPLAQIGGAVLAVVLLSGSSQPAKPDANAAPRTHVITIENMRFDPEELTVKRGDRVVWTNKDLFPHTATSGASVFDSGSIEAGASWTYVTSQPGDYAYVCTFHPSMKGRLSVQ